jgi:moderate conductance mechanosensitive channel
MIDLSAVQISQFLWTAAVSGVRILLILLLAYVGALGLRGVSYYAVRRLQAMDGLQGSDFDRRVETVFVVVKRATYVVIAIVAILMILEEVGVDIRPLLASLGIVGLAIGLGAQTLFRDVISGIFILAENHYQVGDVVEIGNKTGTVERMSLRVTRVRDLHGIVHIIPNGEIRTVANRTREWSRAILDIGVTYEDDIELAMRTLEEIGAGLIEDEDVGPMLLESPVVLGVEALEDWQVRLRIMVKTLPNQHFPVQRTLRRRIQRVFAEKGISLATPRQEVVLLGRPSDSK